ncbi:MAG: S41 family peptidase [Phycisphaeraceae bacterium]
MPFRGAPSLTLSAGLSLLVAAVSLGYPPQIIQTDPPNDARDVDPELQIIRIEFDQPMAQTELGDVSASDNPLRSSRALWIDPQTVCITIRLEPDKHYKLRFNSDTSLNFQNRNGEPAEPFQLDFQTARSIDDTQTTTRTYTPAQQRAAVDLARELMSLRYSHIGRSGMNWNRHLDGFASSLEREHRPERFAMILAHALEPANDPQLFLEVDGETYHTAPPLATPNIDLAWIRASAITWEQPAPHLVFARLREQLPYVAINTWAATAEDAYEPLFEYIGRNIDEPAIVIDLRLNTGGSERIAAQFAGCFMDQPAVYGRYRFRDPGLPGGFTEPLARIVAPNLARPRYPGQVIILSGPAAMGASESFLLMMKTAPRATIVGENSRGASSNPVPHDLANSVILHVPSWKAYTPQGREIQGMGVEPDIRVPWEQPGLLTPDVVIEAAAKYLKSQP